MAPSNYNKTALNTRAGKKELPRVAVSKRVVALVQRTMKKSITWSVIMLCLLGTWFFTSDAFNKTIRVMATAKNALYEASGLVVKHVHLAGREHASLEQILAAADIKIGQAMLELPLNTIKERIEALDWIKHAIVEAQYPSSINIHIVEREPLALWQYKGTMKLIDRHGNPIENASLKPFKNEIILVGKGVPLNMVPLFNMLDQAPEIKRQVSSATLINERRWDIRLHNKVKIKLPEEQTEKAWQALIEHQKTHNILSLQGKTIDLRNEGTWYINPKS